MDRAPTLQGKGAVQCRLDKACSCKLPVFRIVLQIFDHDFNKLLSRDRPREHVVTAPAWRCYGRGRAARQPRPCFIGISKSHTTNLAVVAPGIAEALLATERLGDRTLVGGLRRLKLPSIRSSMTAAVTSVSLLPARTRRRYVRCHWARRSRRDEGR